MARVGVIVFPGSNCDHDAYHALKHVMNAEVTFLWHKETDVSGLDMIIVPGGFSYGDYLRSGAIARFSPIMQELIRYAQKGGNYYIDNDGLKELQDNDQVLFRYVNAQGETTPEANINGSIDHIAGITNKHKNVLGMMPHPERAMERLLGKEDGKHIFESILQALAIA